MKALQRTATTARFLMSSPATALSCEPEQYTEKLCALNQWDTLKNTLENLGADVDVFNSSQQCPAPTPEVGCTAFFNGQTAFVPSNKSLRGIVRQRFIEKWANERGFQCHQIQQMPDTRNIVKLGSGITLVKKGSCHISRPFSFPITSVTVKTTHPRLQTLDTLIASIDEENVLVVKDAIDENSNALLATKFNLIEVPMDEAMKFACQSIAVGRSVVINEGCHATAEKIRRLGYTPVFVSLSSFVGGPQKYALRIS